MNIGFTQLKPCDPPYRARQLICYDWIHMVLQSIREPVCSRSSSAAHGTIASSFAISFASRVAQEATRRPRQLMDEPRPCSSTLSPVALGTECRTLSARGLRPKDDDGVLLPKGNKKSRRRPTLAWAGPTLPSAKERLTSVFGKGTGISTPLWPPAKSR